MTRGERADKHTCRAIEAGMILCEMMRGVDLKTVEARQRQLKVILDRFECSRATAYRYLQTYCRVKGIHVGNDARTWDIDGMQMTLRELTAIAPKGTSPYMIKSRLYKGERSLKALLRLPFVAKRTSAETYASRLQAAVKRDKEEAHA